MSKWDCPIHNREWSVYLASQNFHNHNTNTSHNTQCKNLTSKKLFFENLFIFDNFIEIYNIDSKDSYSMEKEEAAGIPYFLLIK